MIAGMAFGLRPERTWVGPQARAVFAAGTSIGWKADAVVSLAGPVAESWSHRKIIRPYNEELEFYIHSVRNLELGYCDYCRIFLQIFVRNKDLLDHDLLDIYRHIEQASIDFITDRPTERLISRLSDALFEKIELDADAITSLVGADIPLLRVPQF